MITRTATLNDIPTLKTFEQDLIKAERPFDEMLMRDPIQYYDLEQLLIDDNVELVVVEVEQQVIACGYARIKQAKPYAKYNFYSYLGFMFVPEKHRGNGYNRLIINALLKWCKSKKINEIRLDVYENNPSAIKAYEKAGFKKHLINMRLNINNLDY